MPVSVAESGEDDEEYFVVEGDEDEDEDSDAGCINGNINRALEREE